MKRNILLTASIILTSLAIQAQNTMYIMKDDIVVSKYDIEKAIDSIIFYMPNVDLNTSVTDADGNEYNVVTIGTQTWMAENLKTTKYNDGTSIPLVENDNSWENLTTPGYCWYKNDPLYGNFYGALYNWYAVNTGKLCPTGWHVPTQAEWTTLIDYLGGSSIAGGKLKQTFILHWHEPNEATNESGFTALPGGYRDVYTTYKEVGIVGRFWTATESSDDRAWDKALWNSITDVNGLTLLKSNGESVRCVKD